MAFSFLGCAPEEEPVVEEPEEEVDPDVEPPEEAITLRVANFFPGESGQGQMGELLSEGIERVTEGRVEVEHYPGGMLLGAGEMYEGVVEGVADIGISNLGYTFGRFREMEILDLPLGFPNSWVAGNVAQDFYEEYNPEEFDDVHVLTMHTSPVNNIITEDVLVETPEDLAGLNLRGTGWEAATLEAYGASPEEMAMPDAYDYLERGIIEGLLIPYETVDTFGYGEITDHVTEIWELGQVYIFYFVMNNDSWNAISTEDQENIMNFIDEEFRGEILEIWNEIDIGGKQYAIDEGYTITEISEEELPRWRETADTVIDSYIEEMVADGLLTEEEIQERLDFIDERIDYWLEKQIEKGIKSSTGPEEVQVDW